MILEYCKDCDWTGPRRGLGPHRGRKHPDCVPLKDYITVRLRDLSEAQLVRVVDFIQDMDNEHEAL